MSGGLRPVRFPVGTRVGSSDPGKSLARRPGTYPPPSPASTFGTEAPDSSVVGGAVGGRSGQGHGPRPGEVACLASNDSFQRLECVQEQGWTRSGAFIRMWGSRGSPHTVEGAKRPCELTLEAKPAVHHLHYPPDFLPKATNKFIDILPRKWSHRVRAMPTPDLDDSVSLNTGGTGGLVKCGYLNTHRPLGSVFFK